MVKPYCIGSDEWNGLSKIIEEFGEVLQVAGKIIGNEGREQHFSGVDLAIEMEKELGDALAAVIFFMEANAKTISESNIVLRSDAKLERFRKWDEAERAKA